MKRWLLISLVLAGCGRTHDDPPALLPLPEPEPGELDLDPAFRSGARLRAEVLADAAGTRAFSRWIDSELGLTCEFLRSGDGEVRCLPSELGFSAYREPTVAFADPECTRELAHVIDGAKFWVGYPLPGEPCAEPRFPVRNVGALVPAEAGQYRIDPETGACVESSALAALSPGERHFLEDEVPAERFERGERAVATVAGRLRAIEIHGDDGSFERVGIRDTELELDCFAGDGVCVPLEAAFVAMPYVDEACTEHVVNYFASSAFRGADCLPPQLAYRLVAEACGSRVIPHAVGEPYEGALFSDAAGACGSYQSASDSVRSFRLGPELEHGLEPVSPQWLGQGRLRVLAELSAEGARLDLAQRASMQDATARNVCYAHELCDGSLACQQTELYPLFADSRCSRAIYAWRSDTCADPPAAIPAFHHGSCWDGSFVEVGSEVELESAYGKSFGECSKVAFGSDPLLLSTRPSALRALPLDRHVE
jgi:hypothetical protein